MKNLYPDNAVEYFVRYYDYYTPEAYVPRTDTFIEKESSINEQIDRMRHSATRALFERNDVIIVASVSCIYGIGSPETYSTMTFLLNNGDIINRSHLITKLVELQYIRNDIYFYRGTFRVRGDVIDIFPSHYDDCSWRISFFGEKIETITSIDPLTGKKNNELNFVKIFPNSHYVTPKPTLHKAIKNIKYEISIPKNILILLEIKINNKANKKQTNLFLKISNLINLKVSYEKIKKIKVNDPLKRGKNS